MYLNWQLTMKKIQVPADLFLTLARIYKAHKPLDQMTHEELSTWREVQQLEWRAEGKRSKS